MYVTGYIPNGAIHDLVIERFLSLYHATVAASLVSTKSFWLVQRRSGGPLGVRFGLYRHRTGTSVPGGRPDEISPITDIGQRMSLVGGRPDVARRWSELLLLAISGLSRHVPLSEFGAGIGRGVLDRAGARIPARAQPLNMPVKGKALLERGRDPVASRSIR